MGKIDAAPLEKLGEPVYDRLDAEIAYAMMGINAVKGVEIGAGFAAVSQRGTVHGDSRAPDGFRSNNAGGVLDFPFSGGFAYFAAYTANLTANPFDTITTITVQIVALLTGDQDFGSPHTLAAFALGLALFITTFFLNYVALRVVKKYREAYE